MLEVPRTDWNSKLDLIGLAILALAGRVAYLYLASSHLGFQAFATFAPDSQFYHYVADYFLQGHLRGPSVMLMVGPGYPAVLAGLRLCFGSDLLYPILFNVLLGTLAPLVIYGLAARLTDNRLIALAAGLTSALSLTAVCMSCHILTDQPLYTFYAAALYCFVRGYQQRSRSWFVAAGALAAAAAFLRASGQMAVPVFALLALVLPARPLYSSRWQLLSRAGLAALVAGSAVLAWSFRNFVKEDQFVFTTLGMLTVRHCLVAQAKAEDDVELIQKYRIEWGIEDGESDLERYRGAYDRARQRVREAWRDMPGRMVHYYLFNVDTNLRAPNEYVGIQVPLLIPLVQRVNDAVWRYWGYWLVTLSLVGTVLLAIDGRGAAAWILGSHYVVFTLFCGSSFWQGSRLHMTAEIAWAILVPCALLYPLLFAKRLVTRSSLSGRRSGT